MKLLLSVQRIRFLAPKGRGLFLCPDGFHDCFVDAVCVLGNELLRIFRVAFIVIFLVLLTVHTAGMVKDVVEHMLGDFGLFLGFNFNVPHLLNGGGAIDVAVTLNKVLGFATLQTAVNDGEVGNVLIVKGLTHLAQCLANGIPFGAKGILPNGFCIGFAKEGDVVAESKVVGITIGNVIFEARFFLATELAYGVEGVAGAGGFTILGLGGGSVDVEVHGVFLFSFYFVFPLGTI